MENTEMLFDDVVFNRVRIQLEFVPETKLLRVYVTENEELKKYTWGHLPHGYNNFAAVQDMFRFKAKALLDEEVKRTGKSPKEVEEDEGFRHFKNYMDNMA